MHPLDKSKRLAFEGPIHQRMLHISLQKLCDDGKMALLDTGTKEENNIGVVDFPVISLRKLPHDVNFIFEGLKFRICKSITDWELDGAVLAGYLRLVHWG